MGSYPAKKVRRAYVRRAYVPWVEIQVNLCLSWLFASNLADVPRLPLFSLLLTTDQQALVNYKIFC
jgi:hypothetical protein